MSPCCINLVLLGISSGHFKGFFSLFLPNNNLKLFQIYVKLDDNWENCRYLEFSPTSEYLWLRTIICARKKSELFPPATKFQVLFSTTVV